MSALSTAVRREQWEVAAYLLLLGAAKVASRLPPETLAELVALLETHGDAPAITGRTQAAPRPQGLDGGGRERA
jgi:hypothetical protein